MMELFTGILTKTPYYNRESWGDEATNGYTYLTRLNTIICPHCLKRIDCSEIRHEMNDKGEWGNFCKFCRPDLKIILN